MVILQCYSVIWHWINTRRVGHLCALHAFCVPLSRSALIVFFEICFVLDICALIAVSRKI